MRQARAAQAKVGQRVGHLRAAPGAADLRGSLAKPALPPSAADEGTTALYTRKRKGNDAGAQQHKRAFTVKGSEVADGAANFSKVSSTGGNKDKGGAGKSDEQLEHARAKISELERKQDEFRERTAAAQKQKAEYQQDIQMRGHLEKKLVALRAEAEAVRKDAHTASETRQSLQKSLEEIKSETGKLKDKREELVARVRDINQEKSKLRIMLDAADGRRGPERGGGGHLRLSHGDDSGGVVGGSGGAVGARGGAGRTAAGGRGGGRDEGREGRNGRRDDVRGGSGRAHDERRDHHLPHSIPPRQAWDHGGRVSRDARDGGVRGGGGAGAGGSSHAPADYDDGDM